MRGTTLSEEIKTQDSRGAIRQSHDVRGTTLSEEIKTGLPVHQGVAGRNRCGELL